VKLYYSPGACSLSPHIVLAEAGLAYSIEKVDLKTKKTESGADFFAVNAAGYVPALVLDNGEVLTEARPSCNTWPIRRRRRSWRRPPASFERVRLQEMLNFISTEVHKSFSPLFNPAAPEETKAAARALIGRRLDVIEKKLAGRDYLLGDFSVADAYLFTVTSWGRMVGVDIKEGRPLLGEYWSRVKARPAVEQAMREEGLIK
jgi:glutathione S-transferase